MPSAGTKTQRNSAAVGVLIFLWRKSRCAGITSVNGRVALLQTLASLEECSFILNFVPFCVLWDYLFGTAGHWSCSTIQAAD